MKDGYGVTSWKRWHLFSGISIDCVLMTMHALDPRFKSRVLESLYDERISSTGSSIKADGTRR